MPSEVERLNERIKEMSFRADYFERECERLLAENERLENELRIARAEATSVRPGPCVSDRDETMFVEDAAPPRGVGKKGL